MTFSATVPLSSASIVFEYCLFFPNHCHHHHEYDLAWKFVNVKLPSFSFVAPSVGNIQKTLTRLMMREMFIKHDMNMIVLSL